MPPCRARTVPVPGPLRSRRFRPSSSFPFPAPPSWLILPAEGNVRFRPVRVSLHHVLVQFYPFAFPARRAHIPRFEAAVRPGVAQLHVRPARLGPAVRADEIGLLTAFVALFHFLPPRISPPRTI